MKGSFLTTIGLSIVVSSLAGAQVKLFERGHHGQTVGLKHQVQKAKGVFQASGGEVLPADISQTALQFIEENKAHFPALNTSDLSFKSEIKDHLGASLRYSQKYKGISVEGAQLIAIYGKDGDLKTVNSSLKDLSSNIDIEPKINSKLP